VTIKINRITLLALLGLALALAGYWYGSPYITVRQMQAAAQAGDADAFNDHVDYPKLRESFKGQMSALLADKLGHGADSANPFAALGNVLGLAMADKMVDAMVRPEIVMMGMRNGKFAPNTKNPPADTGAAAPSGGAPQWVYVRKSMDRLIAYPSAGAQPDEQGVGIVFERSGFANWKLTEIRLPISKL
jgi:hypothetical protein